MALSNKPAGEQLAAQVPLSDHVARFWRYLETEHVRIMIDMKRVIGDDRDIVYWDGASFSDDVAKALVAERRSTSAQSPQERLSKIDTTQNDADREYGRDMADDVMDSPANRPDMERVLTQWACKIRVETLLSATRQQADAQPEMPDPRAALAHAKTRFECLSEHFDGLADDVSRAMCEVDAEWMARALDAYPQQADAQQAQDDWSCGTCGKHVADEWRIFGSCYKCASKKSIARREGKIARLNGLIRELEAERACPQQGQPLAGPAGFTELRKIVSDEWGSHLCYRHPDGLRSCSADGEYAYMVAHCRCGDIAKAILERYDVRAKASPRLQEVTTKEGQ